MLGQEVEEEELLEEIEHLSPPIPVEIVTDSTVSALPAAGKGILITAGFMYVIVYLISRNTFCSFTCSISDQDPRRRRRRSSSRMEFAQEKELLLLEEKIEHLHLRSPNYRKKKDIRKRRRK